MNNTSDVTKALEVLADAPTNALAKEFATLDLAALDALLDTFRQARFVFDTLEARAEQCAVNLDCIAWEEQVAA
jgi:hypothetical protein